VRISIKYVVVVKYREISIINILTAIPLVFELSDNGNLATNYLN